MWRLISTYLWMLISSCAIPFLFLGNLKQHMKWFQSFNICSDWFVVLCSFLSVSFCLFSFRNTFKMKTQSFNDILYLWYFFLFNSLCLWLGYSNPAIKVRYSSVHLISLTFKTLNCVSYSTDNDFLFKISTCFCLIIFISSIFSLNSLNSLFL